MTISTFANQLEPAGLNGHLSARAAYRQHLRDQAEQRQAGFDTEVRQVARDHNCEPETARDVVRARRHHEHRTGRLTPISRRRLDPMSPAAPVSEAQR
jgi:hypothetical protein